ncbi:ferric iron reductase protein FhuF [Limimonas halophila]|uniref:Ferric iron reductase protein FhuF n=1 Tax=Limimonas halophila TaxID=1082479 RepID=A0A1G7PRL5_9PROT|nr:siderophore-iron reductase FhuF [Limimonas halophila]SDF88926.1 ferric iron reductase protein FhuF [Limimonas halophila]
MIRQLPHAGPVAVARRLIGPIPPAAAIPVYGMSLAPPARLAGSPLIPDRLEAALAGYAAGWSDPEPRAVATQFSKYWFRAAIPPVVVCAAAGRAAPEVAPDALRVEPDGAGIPFLVAPDDPAIGIAPADGAALMDRLVRGHLEPVVAALAARSGLAPRVFWSNAGNVIAWYLEQLRAQPATADAARALAAHWVEATANPHFDGRNPMSKPVIDTTDAHGRPVRRRRVCCARYLSAELDVCGSCPLSSAPAARRAKR